MSAWTRAVGHFSRRASRRRRFNATELLHSEWNQKLGICTLIAIALSMMIAVTFYVVLPRIYVEHLRAYERANSAPPFFGFALAIAIIFLSTHQLTWVAKRMPRNSALYNFAHSYCSQLAAFAIAWSQIFDAFALATFMVQAYGQHFRLLFLNKTATQVLNTTPVRAIRFARPNAGAIATSKLLTRLAEGARAVETPSEIANGTNIRFNLAIAPSAHFSYQWAESTDWLCISMVLVVGIILACSLRVLITITIIFLIAALFTSTSTTIVAVLHNLPYLRINCIGSMIPHLYEQTMANAPQFLLVFFAIEALSYVGEECAEARSAIPLATRYSFRAVFGISFIAFLSFFPFAYRMSATDAFQPVPLVFNSIGVHSARYLMNVGALCGLSAALLCSFLPVTRLLVSLSTDSLVPFSAYLRRLHSKAGAPRAAVFAATFGIIVLIIIVPHAQLLSLVPLNLCARLLAMAVIVYRSLFPIEDESKDGDDIDDDAMPERYERLRNRRRNSICMWNERESANTGTKAKRANSSSDSDVSSRSEDEDREIEEKQQGIISMEWTRYEARYDAEARLLERIWRLSNGESESCTKIERRSPLEQIAMHNGLTSVRFSTDNVYLSKSLRIHNCLRSPCASNYALAPPPSLSRHHSSASIYNASSNLSHASKNVTFHIYQPANDSIPFFSLYSKIKRFTHRGEALKRFGRSGIFGAEQRRQSARRILDAFLIVSGFVAVAHKILWQTAGHVSLLAAISCTAGFIILVIGIYHVYCIGYDLESERAFVTVTASVAAQPQRVAYGVRTTAYGSVVTTTTNTSGNLIEEKDCAAGGAAAGTRRLSIECLMTIFLVQQILPHFAPLDYAKLILYYAAGLFV